MLRFDKGQLSNIGYWKERIKNSKHAKFEGGFAKSKFGLGELARELNILKLKGSLFKIMIQRGAENWTKFLEMFQFCINNQRL